jgi:hypothetical protein
MIHLCVYIPSTGSICVKYGGWYICNFESVKLLNIKSIDTFMSYVSKQNFTCLAPVVC